MVAWIPLAWIILIAGLLISGPKDEAAELDRLDAIVSEVQDALEHEEFSHALRIADSIDYQRYDVEMERKTRFCGRMMIPPLFIYQYYMRGKNVRQMCVRHRFCKNSRNPNFLTKKRGVSYGVSLF